jgi:hypothetical protein
MTDWQLTATTIFCEDFNDEVTIMVYKDGKTRCTGYDAFVKMNSEPDKKTAGLIDGVAEKYPDLPIILTYVYTSKYAEIENGLKEHVAAVFYKPIDLADVSERIDFFI